MPDLQLGARESELTLDVAQLPISRAAFGDLTRDANWFCPCDIDSLTVYGRALNAKEIAARAAETAQ